MEYGRDCTGRNNRSLLSDIFFFFLLFLVIVGCWVLLVDGDELNVVSVVVAIC